jgi:hypothetical protein
MDISGNIKNKQSKHIIWNKKNKTYELKNNMKWKNNNFITLLDNETFNGNGYVITYKIPQTISLFNISATSYKKHSTIKNLTIKSNINEERIGSILPQHSNNVHINNCHHKGSVLSHYSGGICGSMCADSGKVVIEKCSNDGELFGAYCGGICGYMPDVSTNGIIIIKNCINRAIISSEYGGGIVGGAFGSGKLSIIKNCVNYGNMTEVYNGGIVGSTMVISSESRMYILNCINYGSIRNYSGGITTYMNIDTHNNPISNNKNTSIIKNCKNYGAITCSNENDGYSGGIIGFRSCNFELKNCVNYGVNSSNYSSGIVSSNCSNFILNNCINAKRAKIYGNSNSGIIGFECNDFSINECNNYADMNSYQGGSLISSLSYNFIINNCINTGEIAGYSSSFIAGGCYDFTMNNCINKGNISGLFGAGFCGYECYYNILNKCINYGNILSEQSAGICNTPDHSQIIECANYGNIIGKFSTGGLYWNLDNVVLDKFVNHGKILGFKCSGVSNDSRKSQDSNKLEIVNCYNTGDIIGDYCAGISFNNCTNCYNSGNIYGFNCGGIMGYSGIGNINKCYNVGNIAGIECGGIIAGQSQNQNQIINNCYNTGKVHNSANNGGIAGGYNHNTLTITNCYSTDRLCSKITESVISNCYEKHSLKFIKGDLASLDSTIWHKKHNSYPILKVFKIFPWNHKKYNSCESHARFINQS